MLRATSFIRAGEAGGKSVDDTAVLAHDERHLRRKAIPLASGDKVLVDLAEPVALHDGDLLVLEDGRHVAIRAAEEDLLEIVPRDATHLAELCWHIGNRHLPAEIGAAKILIQRDHVIRAMLQGLGAELRDVRAPFQPLRGAYSGHSHGHGHGHAHDHDHSHDRTTTTDVRRGVRIDFPADLVEDVED